jgi:hypothetical protein
MADLVAATDGNPTTLAAYTEITTNLPTLVQERLRANPPPPPPAPPGGRAGGPGGGPAGPRPLRIELRIATDEAGEIYILTKSDGLIRRVVNIR